MKIIDCQQNSLDWLMLRLGVPTASEFDNLVSPTFEVRKGQMPESYLMRKLAEAWTRSPLPGYNTIEMEFGKLREEEAIPWYEFEFSESVRRIGFVTTDDGRIGCSPDGLIGDGLGLEVKCPEAHTHVGYLMAGALPPQYAAQVQGSMFVTGFSQWRFLSYHKRFPKVVLLIERDEKAQAALSEALGRFLEKFDRGMRRLSEINGGMPRPAENNPPPEESFDVIP